MTERDLVKFLEKSSEGLGFSEIAFNFIEEDEGEIRKLLKDCIERNIIKKIGEKRGTKYLVDSGSLIIDDQSDEEYDSANSLIDMSKAATEYDFKLLRNIDKFLKSNIPVHMSFASIKRGNIQEDPSESIFNFIKDGSISDEYTVNFNNKTGKNELIKNEKKFANNAITFKKDVESKEYHITFYNFCHNKYKDFNGKKSFKSFNELKKYMEKLFNE